MRVVTGAGHSPNCDGTSGHGYSENREARRLSDAFRAVCEGHGVAVSDCSSDAATQAAYLSEQVSRANASGADVAVQWHFNSGAASATGTEVLYHPGSADGLAYAERVSAAVAGVLGIRDRGAKARGDLRFINSTSMTALIIEVAFMSSDDDMAAYGRTSYEDIAGAAFTALTGKETDMALTREEVEWIAAAVSSYVYAERDKADNLNNYNALHWGYRRLVNLEAKVDALGAAIEALAKAQGADPETIVGTVDRAVRERLANLKVTAE